MRPLTPSSSSNPPQPEASPAQPLLFMVLAGVFFCIVVIKFGIPIVLDASVLPPNGWLDAIDAGSSYTWPVKWGYLMMIPVFLAGLFAIRWKSNPGKPAGTPRRGVRILLLCPLLWLGWEFISATSTISPRLTGPTLAHFSACVAFFYLGFFALRGARNPWPVWAGLGLALCWVLHLAMEQHFGGLEATRKLILGGRQLYLPPEALRSPEFVRKIMSDRVFGSFMYPNALAAGLLLLLPVTLVSLWQMAPKVQTGIRLLFVAILGGCALACLYWSGSKAAWLFMVLLGVAAIARSPLGMTWKRILVYGVLMLGFIGFTVKYVDSAAHGKRSMEARLIYWQAALQIVRQHPVLGTGPGTFGAAYEPIRPQNAEFARLTHNDYLEQASDSGIIGSLAYTVMIFGSVVYIYRYRLMESGRYCVLRFSVWLGLLGLFLHSGMEFNLYYPALAWPSFFLTGWLFGQDEA